MLVLALDTATDAVVVGLLEVPGSAPSGGTGPAGGSGPADGVIAVLAQAVHPGARRHGETLMPAVLEVCAAAGRRLAELDAVVCGVGPGPFTGLRVGLVSAAGLGDALGVPVHPVCTLDAIAAGALDPGALDPGGRGGTGSDTGALAGSAGGGGLLVVADARRRELYWAAYDHTGRRVAGPAVDAPAVLAGRVPELGVLRVAGPVAPTHAEALGLPAHPAPGAAVGPTPAGLVAVAVAAVRSGRAPAALEPLYLRRPDAVPPAARKRVTV